MDKRTCYLKGGLPMSGWKRILPAAVLLAAALFLLTPSAARLCFAGRVWAAGLTAEPGQTDGLDGNGRWVFRDPETLALIAEVILTSEMTDCTDCQFSTWPEPPYFIGDREVGGNGCLTCHYLGRFYLFEPGQACRKAFRAVIPPL